MKKIEIEIPEGKKAEWVDGVLTLVDEQPVEFKFKVGDKVAITHGEYKCYTIYLCGADNGKAYYWLKDENEVPHPKYPEDMLELYVEQPKDITERIKTFEDACEWCKNNGKEEMAEIYHKLNGQLWGKSFEEYKDILAYLKLRIITCALNEGWKPTFERGEYRWYAWYKFLTNAELDEMTEEQIKERGICRVVGRAVSNAYAVGGLVFSNANYVSSSSGASYGSRLAFKSEELAEYAAKQFIEIYADYCYKGKE